MQSEPIYYHTPMVDPYRLTLSPGAGSAIIPKPGVIDDPYNARELILAPHVMPEGVMTVPNTGATNIINPTLSVPGANPIPQPIQDDGNAVVIPPPISDPVSTTETQTVTTPQWLEWVKAHPFESLGLAFTAYYIGKELFKPKSRKK